MPPDRILVHYTKSPEIVASILRRGFLLVPNRRDLINKFLDPALFVDREPQQFGMVSFSEIPLQEGARHREVFGDFGIGVTWEWARSHNAQRVIYLDEAGPLTDSFRYLFELGKQEIDNRKLETELVPWILTNKDMALMERLAIYPQLLTLYEYMQPEKDSAQFEWRVVSEVPGYEEAPTREELIAELLKLNDAWPSLGTASIAPRDIFFLGCPAEFESALRAVLPPEFRDVPIRTYESDAARLLIPAAGVDAATPSIAPDSSTPTGPSTPEQPGVDEVTITLRLPDVARLRGVTFFPNPVLKRSFLELSYLDEDGKEFLQVLRWAPMFQLTSQLYTIAIDESDQHVARLASAFRSCLDTLDRTSLPAHLQGFPSEASGQAALLLATYLKARGEPGFVFVRGQRGEILHAWLERNGLIVDIAGDRFEDRPALVISRNSDWHREFAINTRGAADLEKCDVKVREELEPVFALLDPLLPYW